MAYICPKNQNIMKLLKSFLILFIAISITSCSSSDDDNSFQLTAENFVGVYALTDYESDVTETATSSTTGNTVELSETENEGSIYSTVVTLNTDGTYSIDGTFVLTSETDGSTTEAVITLETTGTYSLNIISKTITLTETVTEEAAKGAGLVEGTFTITSFNENELELEQTTNATAGSNSINTVTEITLTRN